MGIVWFRGRYRTVRCGNRGHEPSDVPALHGLRAPTALCSPFCVSSVSDSDVLTPTRLLFWVSRLQLCRVRNSGRSC